MTARGTLRTLVAAFMLAAALPPSAGAETVEPRLPQSREEIQLTFAPLVRKVAPAVVNIYTKRVVRTQRSPFFNDPFFRQFFGDDVFNFGLPRERIQNSLGSGVILRPDGVIVTNNHVIEKADQITVVLADRREFEAKLVLADERSDLAVLRIDTGRERLPYLTLRDSDTIEVGDLVIAIGNPFGVGQTVTTGIVSAVARAAQGVSDYSFFIQTDAAINPGNSGGGLVTMDGRLVGINTAIYSRSGGSLGIGFAIPANMVERVLESAVRGTKIARPWFGAAAQPVTSDLAASLGLKRPAGVIITVLHPQGPAARAGLKVGDLVLSVNGQPVDDPRALRFRIASLPPRGMARLEVQRNGRTLTLNLPLEVPPETPPRETTTIEGRNPISGAVVANLSPALAEELSLDPILRGVIVVDVDRRSAAGRIGINPGDMIVKVNNREIDSVGRLRDALRRPVQRWTLVIRRDDKLLSVAIDG